MHRCLVLLLGWLLLAVPALGEPPITPKAGEPMPDEWGDVPEFIASDRDYNSLVWMSEDYLRDAEGRIQWEKLRPDEAEGLRDMARRNSRKLVELSTDSEACLTNSFDAPEYNPGGTLDRLIQKATHAISGSVIDYRQGFAADGRTPSTIYRIQPDLTLKGESIEGPILVRLEMAKISTAEGLVCIGVRADQDPPVTGARVVMFLSDERIWGGLWHVPTAAVFYQNPDGEVSAPFRFKDVKSLASLEENIVKELERGVVR